MIEEIVKEVFFDELEKIAAFKKLLGKAKKLIINPGSDVAAPKSIRSWYQADTKYSVDASFDHMSKKYIHFDQKTFDKMVDAPIKGMLGKPFKEGGRYKTVTQTHSPALPNSEDRRGMPFLSITEWNEKPSKKAVESISKIVGKDAPTLK